MDILDKKKLSILLKKIKVKNFSNKNNEEINLEIIKKIKDLSKKEKNKKRKEQLDLLEKKLELHVVSCSIFVFRTMERLCERVLQLNAETGKGHIEKWIQGEKLANSEV